MFSSATVSRVLLFFLLGIKLLSICETYFLPKPLVANTVKTSRRPLYERFIRSNRHLDLELRGFLSNFDCRNHELGLARADRRKRLQAIEQTDNLVCSLDKWKPPEIYF